MMTGILCSFCCFVFLILDHYLLNTNGDFSSGALLFKMLASACFVIYAFYSIIKCKEKSPGFKKVSSFILSGLLLGFAADLLLEINFYAGFLVFVTAHIFYFLAFSVYSRMDRTKWIILISFVTAFTVIDYIVPWFDFKGLFPFVIVYSAVWAFVFVKCLGSLKYDAVNAKIIVAGIILFGISDLLLQFKFFPAESFLPEAGAVIFFISNSAYYAGQLLIARSISKDFIDGEDEK